MGNFVSNINRRSSPTTTTTTTSNNNIDYKRLYNEQKMEILRLTELWEKHLCSHDEKEEKDAKIQASMILSRVAIEQYVDKLLLNPNINSIVPDSIEKPIYVNSLWMFMNLLQEILSGTKITLLDHELRAYLTTKTEEIKKTET